jgi:hypothetical protein
MAYSLYSDENVLKAVQKLCANSKSGEVMPQDIRPELRRMGCGSFRKPELNLRLHELEKKGLLKGRKDGKQQYWSPKK